MPRRLLPWIVLLAVALHLASMARSIVPAQDGLKFLRVARQFQVQPWDVVIRNSDQHPLYPACVAVIEPVLETVIGSGPSCWRFSAQSVSMLASLLTLWPLYLLSKRLFDEPTATLSVFLWVLLPLPAEIGHDTLADPLSLLGTATALMCAERAYVERSLRFSIFCGLASGLGFLARPEVALVPLALSMALGWRWLSQARQTDALESPRPVSQLAPGLVWVSLGLIVGFYALIKGEVSEKLAVRHATSASSENRESRPTGHALMPGMEESEWDFSAKEESDNPARLPFGQAIARLLSSWAEALGFVGAALALLGAMRVRASAGRVVALCYLGLFSAVLVRHASMLGYLSGRHALSLALVSIPWSAAGLRAAGRRVSGWLRLDHVRSRRLSGALALSLVLLAAAVQLRPAHASRWGHREAGQWITRHSEPADAVLDTRGWAAFESGQPGYDYWHVRQALSDSRLTYIVVGRDELTARSRRADSLRKLLTRTSRLVANFPAHQGGSKPDVQVYRFSRPEEWEDRQP